MTKHRDILTQCMSAPEGSFGRMLFGCAVQSVFGGEDGEKRSQERMDDWMGKQPRVFTKPTTNGGK